MIQSPWFGRDAGLFLYLQNLIAGTGREPFLKIKETGELPDRFR